MRNGLPWILAGLIAGAWAGATWLGAGSSGELGSAEAPSAQDLSSSGQASKAALASQIAELQSRVVSATTLESQVEQLTVEKEAAEMRTA